MLASTELRLKCHPDVGAPWKALLTPGVSQKHKLLGMRLCILGWEDAQQWWQTLCELSDAIKASGTRRTLG